MTAGTTGTAGVSARHEAERARLRIDEYERRLAEERRRLVGFQVASSTERRIAALLGAMDVWGWRLLADRRWPGTRHANVDMLHVGPGGVLVIDVKAWRNPRVESERLWRGDAPADDELHKLTRITRLVEEVTGACGLAPLQVAPVLVFAGRRAPVGSLGRIQLVGEGSLLAWVTARPARLTDDQVTELVAALARRFPAYDEPAPVAVSVLTPDPVVPRPTAPDPDELVLFDTAEVEASLLTARLADPIEDWMTWLHPQQVELVRRHRTGPARLRGPAGTGKTVVGLHRAAYLAATRPGRILYTSFVRTLPTVLGSLYARLAPEHADRVEFVGLHRWAFALLRERRVQLPRCDQDRARTLFNTAWARVGRHGSLSGLEPHPDYWWEEVSCVIKGRGLTDFTDYADLARVGRRTPLQHEHRAAVWDLYLAYDQLLRTHGVCDLNDVLRAAVGSVREHPPDPPYSAVIVDEVQDLNRLGVELVHALVGNRPDGLLLIGDGQQAVYPGGFTLAEAGVSVTGRAAVLRTNYRNAPAVLDVATGVVATDEFDDLDGTAQRGARDVRVVRTGGHVIRVDAPDVASHDAALLAAIGQHAIGFAVPPGDMAVLAASGWVARRYRRLLESRGIACVDLEDYDGTTSARVKVGTFKRAKGLEFKHVYLPLLSPTPPDRLTGEPDPTYRERVELAHRELFVAMTRARDLLWLGYRG